MAIGKGLSLLFFFILCNSIQSDDRYGRKTSENTVAKQHRQRPHSTHLEFDDITIQLMRLRQENDELRESLRLERKESTTLRALNDELGQKLDVFQKEKQDMEMAAKTKVSVYCFLFSKELELSSYFEEVFSESIKVISTI